MEEYLKELVKQYKISKGCFDGDLSSDQFRNEFMSWVENSLKTGIYYLHWLKDIKIFDDSSNKIAEIGKGKYDALTIGCNTTLITPYMKEEECITNSNKIITSRFAQMNSIPLLLDEPYSQCVDSIDTFMIQNPYDIHDVMNWHYFYNYGNLDIIIGAYGNSYDKDKSTKLYYLDYVQRRLKDDFPIREISNGDTYCYALATKQKVKKIK